MRDLSKRNKIMSRVCGMFLLSFIINTGNIFGQTANTWTQKANFGGVGRYGVSAFSIGSKGYMGCGVDGGSVNQNDFWEYDPSTNVWTQKANFAGSARRYATGFSIGTKGYLGCGQDATYKNDFYEYDPTANTWAAKTSFPGAIRMGATGFSIGSKGYMGLGFNGAYFQDFYEYDPSLDTWTAKAAFPGGARWGAVGFSIGTNAYVGSGYGSSILSNFYEYNQGTNTWTVKASMPVARYAAAGFAIGTKGYVGCGNLTVSLQGDDFYEYDPTTNSWTAKANCGGGVRGYTPGGFSIGTKGYIGCGFGVTAYKNDFWEYNTLTAAATLNFDGTNDYVEVGNSMNSILDPLNKITVEAWVKPSNNTYLGVIVGNYATPVGQMQFLLRRDNSEFAFWVDDGTGFKVVNSGVNTSTVGAWQHVAGVWDGSKIMIYINGVLKATTTGVTGTSFATTSNSVRMGNNNMGTPEIFAGNLDEVRIWTSARTQCEINTYKNCEIATTSTGLLANYHFNQGSDAGSNPTETSLLNSTGGGYNGTLTNFGLTGSTSNWITPGGVTSGSVTPANLTPTITATPSSTTLCNSQQAVLSGGGASTYSWTGGITNATAFTATATTNYTVTGTSAVGCTNTAVASVSVNNCTAAAALNVDGTNDFVSVPHNTLLNFGTGDFSVESYFKSSVSQPNYAGVVVKQNSGGNGGWQLVVVGNKIAAEISSSTVMFGVANGLQGTTTITDGNWHHLAMVVTRSQNKIELFVDGNVEATLINANVSTMNVNFSTPVLIGVERTYTAYSNANIDEVRLWNVARTKCQLNTYKNCEIATTSTGLVANYHFNQGFAAAVNSTVTTLTDASGNSNTGTLFNLALTGATSNWIAPGAVITGSTTPASLIPVVTASPSSTTICNSQSAILNGGGASTYVWTGSITNNTAFSPTATASYTVTGTNPSGCTNTAVATVNVNNCTPAAGLSFDGTNDYVNLGTSSVLKPTAALTAETWAYMATWTGVPTLLGNTELSGYAIFSTGTMLRAIVRRNGVYAVAETPLSGISSGWHHFAVTYDGRYTKLYMDGILQMTDDAGANYPVTYVGNSTLLGAEAGGGTTATGNYFNGKLDEVRIWSVARTQCEINTYKNCEIATTATGLVGNYHFNHGFDAVTNTVTTLTDVSGNSITGTLTNFALTGATSNWISPGGVVSGSVTPASLTPTVTASATNSVICNGASTTLNGGGASAYVWTGGVTNGTSFFPTSTQSYTVTGTNSTTGCTNTAVQGVTVNALPVVTTSATNSVICNGASTTLNGGGATTYVWTGGVTNGTSFSPTSTQSYTVTGTNATTGCTNTAVQGVTVNALPVVTASATNSVICNGASTTLNGGGASTYVWSGGVTNGTSFSPTSTQSYTVTGTNATTGCTNTAVQGVTVNALPVVTASATNSVICNGASTTLNGGGASTYVWTGGVTNGTSFSPTSTQSYTVTGTNATTGCTNTAVQGVTVNALPLISVNSGAICEGQSFTMLPSGATTYTYSSGSAMVSPTITSSFSVSGTDANGCVSSSPAVSNVTVNAAPAITVNSGAICAGESFTMTPSGASTYTFSSGSAIVTPVTNTSYSVTGTDAIGCVSLLSAVSDVTVNALPVVTTTISNAVICEGSTTTLNGGGADTYAWTGGVMDGVSFTPLTSGSYTVTGTNTLTGCTNTAIESVTVNTLPVVTAAISNSVICEGATTTLMGGGADTYTWTGGITDGVAFTPTVSGSYTVTGTSTLTGCTSTNVAVESVTVNPTPTITAASGAICAGGSFTITPGGANTYTITGGSNVVSPSSTTSYTVDGTSLEGCIGNSAVVTVSVQSSLTVSVSGPSQVCMGQSITLTANGAAAYSWNTGANTNSIVATPTTNTTYSVTGSSGTCSDSTVVSIIVNSNPTLTTVSSNSLICAGQTVSLTANGALTYTWSTSATGATIIESPTVTTTYTVTGEDANGCMTTDTVQQGVSPCTGIQSYSSLSEIKVYPNPGSGLATIELYSEAQVVIINSIGEVISNEKLSEGNHQLDITAYANGIYFVKVIREGHQQTIKLIKE